MHCLMITIRDCAPGIRLHKPHLIQELRMVQDLSQQVAKLKVIPQQLKVWHTVTSA